MKIAQMGFYSTNTGDSAALYNIRRYIDGEWTSINMNGEANAYRSVPELINFFIDINTKYDLLLVGGAGLIEGGVWNNATTGWKLPYPL